MESPLQAQAVQRIEDQNYDDVYAGMSSCSLFARARRAKYSIKVSLSDTLEIKPKDFSKPSERAIEDGVNAKYADRIIHKVGLCVCFHSIISASEGLIGHGTGTVHVNVDFRIIVFRPFKGEILAATIAGFSRTGGIALSLGFFDDMNVPPETLFENTKWERDVEASGDDEEEGWVWVYKTTNEETGEENEFYFDRAEKCLVRVEEERWIDMPPTRPGLAGEEDEEEDEESGWRKVPYFIRGSMMHTGLGPRLWWEG